MSLCPDKPGDNHHSWILQHLPTPQVGCSLSRDTVSKGREEEGRWFKLTNWSRMTS